MLLVSCHLNLMTGTVFLWQWWPCVQHIITLCTYKSEVLHFYFFLSSLGSLFDFCIPLWCLQSCVVLAVERGGGIAGEWAKKQKKQKEWRENGAKARWVRRETYCSWVTRMKLQPGQHFSVCKSSVLSSLQHCECECIRERGLGFGGWITAVKPGCQSVTPHLFPSAHCLVNIKT